MKRRSRAISLRAFSVITSRALPDVRDGLAGAVPHPVHDVAAEA
jgi:DNA gyrase/topoisomerase IV subunit A